MTDYNIAELRKRRDALLEWMHQRQAPSRTAEERAEFDQVHDEFQDLQHLIIQHEYKYGKAN